MVLGSDALCVEGSVFAVICSTKAEASSVTTPGSRSTLPLSAVHTCPASSCERVHGHVTGGDARGQANVRRRPLQGGQYFDGARTVDDPQVDEEYDPVAVYHGFRQMMALLRT